MQIITISHNEEGRRLDRYLVKVLPGAGLSFICKMLRKKNITVNGSKAHPDQKLNEGDRIRMFFSDETYEKLLDPNRRTTSDQTADTADLNENYDGPLQDPVDKTKASLKTGGSGVKKNDPATYIRAYSMIGDIDIIYEDGDFIFVDKPFGVLSQKSVEKDVSMNEWLVGRCLDLGELTEDDLSSFKPAFANRLDRNTSGLILGGKTLKALQILSSLLKERDMHKYYLCLAMGKPDDRLPVTNMDFTDIRGFLVKDKVNNISRVYDNMEKAPNADMVLTGFKLVEQYEDPDRMLLEIDLHTGKSHQIRAQLSALGHPIIGDAKYGMNSEGGKNAGYIKRSGCMTIDNDRRRTGQLLHAYRVVFPDLPQWPAISGREFVTKKPDLVKKF